MAVDLQVLLPPMRVRDDILPSDNTALAAGFEAEVRDAILCGIGRNPDYRYEMVQLWSMCFLGSPRGDCEVDFGDLPATLTDDELANVARRMYDGDRRGVVMGSILVELGFRRIRCGYGIGNVDVASSEENSRLKMVVAGCAEDCPFEKTGDVHLHALVRLLLPAAEEASVGEQTPYDAIDRSYDKQTSIKLVRPLFEEMPAKRAETIDYSETSRSCDLVLVCGIIGEHIDDAKMDVGINGRLLVWPKKTTGLFAFQSFGTLPDGYGICRGTELLYSDGKFPLCSVIKAWASCTPGANDIYLALTDPTQLRSTSKFRAMLSGHK
jgi:hypothetical protein